MRQVCIFLFLLITTHIQSQNLGLHVEDDLNVLFGETLEGTGVKFLWLPEEASIRAGLSSSDDSIGYASAAFGIDNKALEQQAMVWGESNTGDNALTTVWGSFNVATAENATVWGHNSEGHGANSTVWGGNNIANSLYETVIGRYAKASDTTDDDIWNEGHQLFAVGNGDGASFSDRNNAFTVLKNGKIGINTHTIGANDEMHIDGNESANPSGSRIRIKRADNGYCGIVTQNTSSEYFVGSSNTRPGNFEIFNNSTARPALSISNDGKLGIDTPSGSDAITHISGAKLTISGTWTDASDESKKKNIREMSYGLNQVMSIRPVKYQYRIDNSQSFGFVAQELEKVLPEIVFGEDGNKSVGYGQITAVLTKAIQEQQEIINEQQKENEELANRISKLESLVKQFIASKEGSLTPKG